MNEFHEHDSNNQQSHTSITRVADLFVRFDPPIHNDALITKFISERKYEAIYLNSLILWMRKLMAGKLS